MDGSSYIPARTEPNRPDTSHTKHTLPLSPLEPPSPLQLRCSFYSLLEAREANDSRSGVDSTNQLPMSTTNKSQSQKAPYFRFVDYIYRLSPKQQPARTAQQAPASRTIITDNSPSPSQRRRVCYFFAFHLATSVDRCLYTSIHSRSLSQSL